MADNSFLGVENAINSSTTFRKNYTTSTPSQQTGYEATNLREEHLGLVYRGATADVGYTPLLARFDDTYNVGIPSGLGHNLSPSATWRMTLDTEAVRPVWITDGVDDQADTAETIPETIDITVFVECYIHPPTIDSAASTIPILEMRNTGSGSRFDISIQAANIANPFDFLVRTRNYSTSVPLIVTNPGGWVRMAYRYRASDDAISFYLNGTEAATGTASATLVGGEGATKITLATTGSGAFLPVRYRHISIYNRYMTDSETSSYDYRILDGTERGLIGGWNFTEGTGSSVADIKATSNLTLTGGTWADMANAYAAHSTGILEAIGQWVRRQGLRVGTGYSNVTSPDLGTAPRDVTFAAIVRVDADYSLGTSVHIASYGPSASDYEIRFTVTAAGLFQAQSRRTSTATVATSTAINDGVTRLFVATLKSDDNTASTLELFTSTDGVAYTSVGTASTGAYDAAASCKIELGLASSSSSALLSSVRAYGAVRTSAVVNLGGAADLSDPDIIESLLLDGSIASQVDTSRVYTTASLTYETLDNPDTQRPAAGREGLGHPYSSGREQIEAELIDLVQNADVEASEVFLEVWDSANAGGYVELGALCCWSTVRPEENRIAGAERTWKQRRALRTDVSGIPYLEDAWEALAGRIRLKYLNIIDEQDEVLRRVLRARRDKLVCLVIEPTRLVGNTLEPLPQHLLVDHCVIGTLSASTETVKEGSDRHVELDIEVEGVRRQTA